MAKAYTAPATVESPSNIWKVIIASSLGTMIEWYDFYIFGSLAAIIATKFFPETNPTAAFLSTLATFGAGFAARPFGALFFGRIGDLVGRKYAFLVTLLIMGGATTLIGLLPTYHQIGLLAPIILFTIRILQGLALGGEYGGAAVYVAEHSPSHRRGYYTSFIQTTATLGLFVSLAVIVSVRLSMSREAFNEWGWRIPFLLSIFLVGLSVYIRTRMSESPLFAKLKAQGKTSKSPIRDSFGSKAQWRTILVVLFGAAAGQAVIWYVGQFYALYFLQSALKVEFVKANVIVAVALAFGLPLFIFFGWLSDRIGRKKVMMAGNLLGALALYPTYRALSHFAGPITPAVMEGDKVVTPAVAASANPVMLTILIFTLLIWVGMVYGPIAAFLVEAFPARIRYTSVSLPYHVANGYFGGFLPLIGASLVAATGNIYTGLIWPISIALMTFVVGTIFLRETSGQMADDEAELHPARNEMETSQAG
ncbi:MAG: MHS family MFS transporter [Chloroflexaceae bacterium]|nr:MHS family MFS transporter [Chloroflexaceae bacterium]